MFPISQVTFAQQCLRAAVRGASSAAQALPALAPTQGFQQGFRAISTVVVGDFNIPNRANVVSGLRSLPSEATTTTTTTTTTTITSTTTSTSSTIKTTTTTTTTN